jgi:hypothetical protein
MGLGRSKSKQNCTLYGGPIENTDPLAPGFFSSGKKLCNPTAVCLVTLIFLLRKLVRISNKQNQSSKRNRSAKLQQHFSRASIPPSPSQLFSSWDRIPLLPFSHTPPHAQITSTSHSSMNIPASLFRPHYSPAAFPSPPSCSSLVARRSPPHIAISSEHVHTHTRQHSYIHARHSTLPLV